MTRNPFMVKDKDKAPMAPGGGSAATTAPQDGFDDGLGPTGFYDGADSDDDDLWFLGPDLDVGEGAPPSAYAMPGPRADHRNLIDLDAWRAAEAGLARKLAELTFLQGQLVTRLAQRPIGPRLALQEAADLSWLAGDRVPRDRLALWWHLRLSGDAEDSQDLLRAGWVLRRLTMGLTPRSNLGAFLGRRDPAVDVAGETMSRGAGGASLAGRIADWQEVMAGAGDLHPLTQAALSFHLWPVLGLSESPVPGHAAPVPLMEAAVVAARLAAPSGVGGRRAGDAETGWCPLALGGAQALRWGGPIDERLRRWIAGAGQGVRHALRLLADLDSWEQRALTATQDLAGRTPPALIQLLRETPLVSAPLAEQTLGVHRVTIQRNLIRLTSRGIAREMTGQGRYRVWTANL